MTWETTTSGWGRYTLGFTRGHLGNDPGLVGVVSYANAYFMWDLVSGGHAAEPISPYTEHAYAHPEGANDRFAPAGIDYYRDDAVGTDVYFGIDQYSNAGRTAWVLTVIPEDHIRR